MIESEGIETYTVDAGGDMRIKAHSKDDQRIGLEHPDDPKQVIGVVSTRRKYLWVGRESPCLERWKRSEASSYNQS